MLTAVQPPVDHSSEAAAAMSWRPTPRPDLVTVTRPGRADVNLLIAH